MFFFCLMIIDVQLYQRYNSDTSAPVLWVKEWQDCSSKKYFLRLEESIIWFLLTFAMKFLNRCMFLYLIFSKQCGNCLKFKSLNSTTKTQRNAKHFFSFRSRISSSTALKIIVRVLSFSKREHMNKTWFNTYEEKQNKLPTSMK